MPLVPKTDMPPSMPSALGKRNTVWDGDGHSQPTRVPVGLCRGAGGLAYHGTGNRVDGGCANGLVKPGLGDTASAHAAINHHVGALAQRHPRHDEDAVRDVWVIPRVLLHRADRPCVTAVRLLDLHHNLNARRRRYGYRGHGDVTQKELRGRARGRGRAGAGGVSTAQELASCPDIVLKPTHRYPSRRLSPQAMRHHPSGRRRCPASGHRGHR